jgi:hypothetical protein
MVILLVIPGLVERSTTGNIIVAVLVERFNGGKLAMNIFKLL